LFGETAAKVQSNMEQKQQQIVQLNTNKIINKYGEINEALITKITSTLTNIIGKISGILLQLIQNNPLSLMISTRT